MQNPNQEGISEMNATSTRNVSVEAGGTQVVGHVGLHALGRFADRLSVGEALSGAIGWRGAGTPVHDRGRVVTQAMLMLAGGGESCADIEALGVPGAAVRCGVFGYDVVSHLHRDARSGQRRVGSSGHGAGSCEVWRRTTVTDGDGPVMLDVDATLVEVHSENKDGTAAHFRGGLEGFLLMDLGVTPL